VTQDIHNAKVVIALDGNAIVSAALERLTHRPKIISYVSLAVSHREGCVVDVVPENRKQTFTDDCGIPLRVFVHLSIYNEDVQGFKTEFECYGMLVDYVEAP
jgi:hypothetical protein